MTDISLLAAAQTNRMAHAVFGIVSAVDPTNHAIKVRVQPENIETGWMPDVSGVQSGDLRIACPSSIGTHVVLIPIEGDAEQFITVGALFDAVVAPPHVPGTGRVIQPGEWMVKAGCGVPDGQSDAGDGGWCLVSSKELLLGLGDSFISINNKEIKISSGGVDVSVSSDGVRVRGGDVQTDRASLNGHIHFVGNQQSTGPMS